MKKLAIKMPENQNSQVGTQLGKNIKVSQPLDFDPIHRSKQRGLPSFKGIGAFCTWAYHPDGAWPLFKWPINKNLPNIMKSFLILKNLAELGRPMEFGLVWFELKTENFINFFCFSLLWPHYPSLSSASFSSS